MKRLLPLLGLAIAACAGKPKTTAKADTLTTRQRQEAIGKSGIPGAVGITRAIQVADSATARNRILDSLNH